MNDRFKQMSTCSVFFTLWVLLVSPEAHSQQVIYGLDQAHQFKSSKPGPFRIQVASFKSNSNAVNYQRQLAKQTSVSITIETRGTYHIVFLGPLPTALSVRECLSTKKSTVINKPTQSALKQVKQGHKRAYFIQTGTFRSIANATRSEHQLRKETGYPVAVRTKGQYHLVIVGPVPSKTAVKGIVLKETVSGGQPNHLGTREKSSIRATQLHSQQSPVTLEMKNGRHEYPKAPTNTSKHSAALTAHSARDFMATHGYIQADLGLTHPFSTESMRVNNGAVDPYPANTDLFSTTDHKKGGMASFMAGSRWETDRSWLPAYSLALRYQHLFNQRVAGTITQYSDPDFVNYDYQWKTQSNVLSVFSKINLTEAKHFSPYVNLGLGGALNQSRGYEESPLGSVIARSDSPAFGAHTQPQLSYSLGAGLDYQIQRQWVMSLGYEFQNLAAMTSGFGQTKWSAEKLALDPYKTNAVLLSLSYLVGG